MSDFCRSCGNYDCRCTKSPPPTKAIVLEGEADETLRVHYEPTPGAAYIDIGGYDRINVVETLEKFDGKRVRITIEPLEGEGDAGQ